MSISKPALIISLVLIVVSAVYLFTGPVPQWPDYHDFADQRSWLGLSNAQNVLSNLGLLLVGAWGVVFLFGRRGKLAAAKVWPHYLVFFGGIFLTALGSAYYHFAPDNLSLVWDRLPMMVMFAGFLTIVIGELMDHEAANTLLVPFLLTGIASVVYWIQSELAGSGDLRFYGLVQHLPGMIMLLMLVLYPRPAHFLSAMMGLLLFFGLAKLFEIFDHQVYQALNEIVAGHAIKHLFAAIAPVFILWMLYRRDGLGSE